MSTKKSFEAPDEPMDIGISLFEGVEYDDFNFVNPRTVKLVLQTGRTGECEACGGVTFTVFFEGLWLCYADIKEAADESSRMVEHMEDDGDEEDC